VEFLNYHHLRYFWVAAKEGGLTRAAEKLRVSQPSICTQIQSLEHALGEKLFRRTPRGLALTEAGQKVFSFAEEIFSLGDDLLNTMKQRPTARPLRVSIGITDSFPKLLANEILKPVFSMQQAVHVICREGKMLDLLAQLTAHRLDIVLADEPSSSSVNFKAFNHSLGETSVTVCAEKKLAARLKRGFPKSLHRAPALLPAENTVLRRAVEAWLREQCIQPQVVAEFEDMALMKLMASEGRGFIAVPSIAVVDAVKHYQIQSVGVAHRCRIQFHAITAGQRVVHPAVALITARARALFSHWTKEPPQSYRSGARNSASLLTNLV